MKGGVIIIGSLHWDTCNDRTWRKNSIDINQGCPVYLPIRYGRKSRSRKYTYTMACARAIFKSESAICSYGISNC